MPRPGKSVDRDALLKAVRERGPLTVGTLSTYALGYRDNHSKGLQIALIEMERAGLIKHEDRRHGTKVWRMYRAGDST